MTVKLSAGGLRFAHHTRRTALTTMGSTASLGGVHERSAPLEKLLAQLEWISIHRGGKLFATVKYGSAAIILCVLSVLQVFLADLSTLPSAADFFPLQQSSEAGCHCVIRT